MTSGFEERRHHRHHRLDTGLGVGHLRGVEAATTAERQTEVPRDLAGAEQSEPGFGRAELRRTRLHVDVREEGSEDHRGTLPPAPLAIELIEQIRGVVEVPLVLHGASGVPVNELKAAIGAGVHKLNADTDLRLAFRRGIEETWNQGDRQLETAMARGRELMRQATVEKMREYGCAGRASDFQSVSAASRAW